MELNKTYKVLFLCSFVDLGLFNSFLVGILTVRLHEML